MQICEALGITDDKRKRRVEKALSSLVKKRILTEDEGIYTLNQQYIDNWERTKTLTIEVGDQIFSTKTPTPETPSSMKIIKNGKEHWLTTLDIAFLTLFALQMLMEECWRKSSFSSASLKTPPPGISSANLFQSCKTKACLKHQWKMRRWLRFQTLTA